MSLIINPDMLGPAYDYLRATKPFSGWHLPPASDIVFKVIPHKDRCAHYFMRTDGRHEIAMSSHWNTRHVAVLSTLAHEMIHLYQRKAGRKTRNSHNPDFWRLADRVCKIHVEFDRTTF